MSAALDGELEPLLPRDSDRGETVRRVPAPGDSRRSPIESCVPDATACIVARVPVLDHFAAEGLGEIGTADERVVPVLLQLLDNADGRVRLPAVDGLGAIGTADERERSRTCLRARRTVRRE